MMRKAYMQRTQRQALIAVILVLLLCGAGALWWNHRTTPARPKADQAASGHTLSDEVRADLASWCVQRWQGDTSPYSARLDLPAHAVYLAARKDGQRLTSAWGQGATVGEALGRAISQLGNKARLATTLELFIALEAQPVDAQSQRRRLTSNIHRGIVGIEEVRNGKVTLRHSPTEILATNRSHEKLLGPPEDPTTANPTTYNFLIGPQLLIDLVTGTAHPMERGNDLVSESDVSAANVEKFAADMGQWMWSNLEPSGRMTYLYWPSRGTKAPGRDNLIRQFMASIALGRLAAAKQDPDLWQRSAANIDHNLETYYRLEGELGLVQLRGKVKLGAVALAALAIVEHRDRQRWQAQEQALRRTVDSLWQDDGSFRTFHLPRARNDNQNFYPGEALLLWASLYARAPDPALLERFMKSFAYYRQWHLDATAPGRRNPAFVPWHTQAYYLVWQHTHDERLRDFIFEMNDWLLDIQQWDDVLYPDTRGRFYAPDHDFGPPHASATGVYLEGLIDAYALARSEGDTRRTKKYAEAIRRGLRSSMQLQFADDVDMFYVSKKERVRGGLRTTVYDNQIRCDNVQHTLMGALKILASDALQTPPTSE